MAREHWEDLDGRDSAQPDCGTDRSAESLGRTLLPHGDRQIPTWSLLATQRKSTGMRDERLHVFPPIHPPIAHFISLSIYPFICPLCLCPIALLPPIIQLNHWSINQSLPINPSVPMSIPCPIINLSISLSIHPSIDLYASCPFAIQSSIYPSANPSIYRSLCPPVHSLSNHQSIHQPIHPSIDLYVRLSIRYPIINLSISQSIHLSISMSPCPFAIHQSIHQPVHPLVH
ncbi:hypothetical protein DNTS_010897 [Danionella cerebrum]|uniref:Uncharacterized protein n=1 Tax=Danionella cerebrum TaxID=2873325 RepID=A0A553PE99_9TELE|nr:hypothetical protein DNTS_010897 [Danionella translucida]